MKRILVSAILALCVCASSSAQTVTDNFVDAVSLYSAGNYTRAEHILDLLSKADETNDAVWYYLGMSRYALGDTDSAESCLRKASELDGGNYWYRRSLARLLFTVGRTEEGVAMYESIVRDFPDMDQISYELLEIYLGQKDLEKALSILDDIDRVRGVSEEAVRIRYDIYTGLGRHEDAIATLERFNENYSSPLVLSLAGDYYLADFSDSLAQARYLEALDLDSSYAPAVLGISEVYRRARNYPDYFRTMQGFFSSPDIPGASKGIYLEKVVRMLDPKIQMNHRAGFDSLAITAARVHPTDTTVLSKVGGYFYSTGRQDAAGVWFMEAAKICPESRSLTATVVHYLYLRENWISLKEYAMDAFTRFRDIVFMEYANMACYNMKDYDAVIANSRQVLAGYPEDKELCLSAWASIGDAYHEKGDSRNAYKAYEKALRINPDYAPVLNNYAYYLSLEGKQLGKAYKMSQKTIGQQPDNATYLDTFAWILHLQGKDIEAKPFFKRAMMYGGKDSATILEHYADVLDALGEHDVAATYRIQAKAKK